MKTIAIIIGISDYSDSIFETIPGAHSDAARFSHALESWGLPKEWIHCLYNEEATKANIIKLFYKCRSSFDSDAKLIFYFSGHGIREQYVDGTTPESSLICHDTQRQAALATSLRLIELMQLIRTLKPTQAFLFIDACHLRLNQIDNLLNDENIFSTSNSKGLFCLLSSGIKSSYEDTELEYGFFTNGLLKAFSELRHHRQSTCHDLVQKVTKILQDQNLPLPEAYHIGLEDMWPLEQSYHVKATSPNKNGNSNVARCEALAKLQDLLVSSPDPVVWMWGEGGIGKSVIIEQFSKQNENVIVTSVPTLALSSLQIVQSIISQIHTQKGEIFFNRAPATSLLQTFQHIASHTHETILIIDHLDRISSEDLAVILAEIDSVPVTCILVSRYPCTKSHFNNRKTKVIEWLALPLNLEELEELVANKGLDTSISSLLLNASEGHALKVRQLLERLSGEVVFNKENLTREFVHAMSALSVCGGFLDEQLFCQTCNLKSSTLSSLEKLGMIRYTSNGCYPHDTLLEMIVDGEYSFDVSQACDYWSRQIHLTPYNRRACRSLIVLATQTSDVNRFKEPLAICLETLNDKGSLSFLIDLVALFQRMEWEDLLLKSTDYLIDNEAYQLAGEVLDKLLESSNRHIREYAGKNDARLLVWLGRHTDCIQRYSKKLEKCHSPLILIPLRNNLALANFFVGHLEHAMKLAKENMQHKGKIDEKEMGIAKYMAGLIMTYRGEDIVEAKELLECSMQIFETKKNYSWSIIGLNALCDLSYRLEQWHQALYYLEKAQEIADSLQNKLCLIYTLRNFVRVHLRLSGSAGQELCLCVDKIEQMLAENREVGHDWATMWAQNTLATVYAHRHEKRKLQNVMDELIKTTCDYKECYIYTLSNLGHLAVLKKDEVAAKNYYQEAYALAQDLSNELAAQEIKQDFIGCKFSFHLQESFFDLSPCKG